MLYMVHEVADVEIDVRTCEFSTAAKRAWRGTRQTVPMAIIEVLSVHLADEIVGEEIAQVLRFVPVGLERQVFRQCRMHISRCRRALLERIDGCPDSNDAQANPHPWIYASLP